MSSAEKCKECGAIIPDHTPAGFCAKCLLTLGLAASEELPAASVETTAAQGARQAAIPGTNGGERGEGITLRPMLSEKPGNQIGRYKLLQKIGEGGCGVVYMAEQVQPVRRRVALKVIKLGMDTRRVVARFEAERQALALMDHPNIAKVLDAGATDSGRPYFVMELVGGTRITDYCDAASSSTSDRLKLFVQVCQAIQHAHQKGIIHRDIKPSNVLVTVTDGVPVPKVIDFGIAKATAGPLTDKTVFTAFEQFMGTPAYMSPEQAEMTSLDIDTRSDIYSLGVLLYELLTGKLPFDSQELLQSGLDELRRTIREKEPARPSTRLSTMVAGEIKTIAKHRHTDPPKLLHQVRGDLDWIVMKCLEKDRPRRYETSNALAMDIHRHLNNEPVIARPPSRFYEFHKTLRRHKFGFAATSAVIAALACGVVASSVEAVRARHAQWAAVRARSDATEKLWSSYLGEARGRRHSGEAGQRFESLIALSNAAAIRPSLELRNEAIACLALADVRLVRERRFKRFQELVNTDDPLERYALGEPDGTVRICRVSDDHELMCLPAEPGVNGAARPHFSRDGKSLALYYGNRPTRIWDLASDTVHTQDSVGWPSSDNTFLVAEESNSIAIFDATGRQKLKRVVTEQPVTGLLAYRPDSRAVALTTAQTNLLIIDIERAVTLQKLIHPMMVYAATWQPNGECLVTTCEDNLIYVWNAKTWVKVRTLEGHQGTPVSVHFTHDSRFLISDGWDGWMRLWDFDSGRQLVISPPGDAVPAFTPDDHTLSTSFRDWSGFQVFDVAFGSDARTVYDARRAPGAPSGSATFSASGRLLVYDTADGATLYDVKAGREIGSINGTIWIWGFDQSDTNVLGVHCSSDGQPWMFRWSVQRGLDGKTNARPFQLAAKVSGAGGCLSANRKVCAVVGKDSAQVFRTDRLEEVSKTGTQPGMASAFLSPDGHLLATATFHGAGVKIWDTATGDLIRDLPDDPGQDATTVIFSPDGRWLVVGTSLAFQFWEVGTWSAGLRIIQQQGSLFAPVMAFSPDGSILAGTFAFRKVRLFNAATGEILGDLEPQFPSQVTYLSFSPDGTRLAVCEGHTALHLWDLRSIREQLATIGLDWNLPPYPQKLASASKR